MSMKNSTTPSGIDPTTFRFVAQHLMLPRSPGAMPLLSLIGFIMFTETALP